MKNLHLNYSLFSRYRTEIMGLAAVFIVLFHSTTVVAHDLYKSVAGQLNIGVELFLITSGTGLYFSLSKGTFSFRQYYTKRILNVYLVYLIIFLPVIIFHTIRFNGSITDFLLDWTGIAFFTGKRYVFGNHGAWYVMFIMVVYAVYPLIFRIQKKLESVNADLICLIAFSVLYILMCYYLSAHYAKIYNRYEVALTRLPVFLTGSYIGKLVYNKKDFSYGTYLAAALGTVVYLFAFIRPIPFVPARYYKLLFAFSICAVLVVLLSALKVSVFEKVLRFFGGMSLELYLTHNLANEFLFKEGHCHSLLQYVLIVCISIAVSYFISLIRVKTLKKYDTKGGFLRK